MNEKQYLYVDNYEEALFFLANKMIEMEENYPVELVRVDNGLNKGADGESSAGLAEGWSISNYFTFNNIECLISMKKIGKVMEDLNKSKIIKSEADVWYSLSDMYRSEGRNTKEVYEEGIKIGQYYPKAKISDINFELIVNFQILSKSRLLKILKPLNKKFIKFNDLNVHEKGHSFAVDYNWRREIKINGILLSKPDFCSKNDIAFSYIFKHPNSVIKREEIPDFSKSLLRVLDDLGFKGLIKDLFFPGSTKDVVSFVNPITNVQLKTMNLNTLNVNDIKKEIENIRNKRSGNKRK